MSDSPLSEADNAVPRADSAVPPRDAAAWPAGSTQRSRDSATPLAPESPPPVSTSGSDPPAGNGKQGAEPGEIAEMAGPEPAGPEAEPSAAPSADDAIAKRSEWSNWAVLAVLVLCFVLIIRLNPRPAPQAFWQADEARSLDRIVLVPLTPGARSVHSDDLVGKVVLLSFWAASDPKAPRGISRLTRVKRALEGQGDFRLLAVCCGPSAREDIEALKQSARTLIDEAGVGIDAYADPGGLTRRAVDATVGLRAYPTTVLIDRQGRVRGAWYGIPPTADQQMRQLGLTLLRAE